VAGHTPNSLRAVCDLKRILDDDLKGAYTLDVVDILRHPDAAEKDNVLATPMLAKLLPTPVRRVIGNFHDRDKVLKGLNMVLRETS
jgi:circadian clock protein KaiB